MPHAALWVVQLPRFNNRTLTLTVSMPHAALWVVQQKGLPLTAVDPNGFNAARGFVGGAALEGLMNFHALCVSMPHAALWVVQRRNHLHCFQVHHVSMPHAALWVVQHISE